MPKDEPSVPWFLWPFYAVWRLVSFVLAATGRVVCGILGIALIIVGGVVTLTIVAAPLGIALIVLGALLLARAIF